jgi:hypothetical protein
MLQVVSLVTLACLAAACGSSRDGGAAPDAGAVPDAPEIPREDIRVDLHGGVQVYDHPEPGLGSVVGTIDVSRRVGEHGEGAERIAAATVALNGVALPKNAVGAFTLFMAPGLMIGPGTQVELVVMAGGNRISYTFDCPDVVMTAPGDGAAVKLGDPVVASWTGLVTNYEGSIDTAMIRIDNYDSVTGHFGVSFKAVQTLDGTTQTATLVTPSALDPGYDGLAVALLVPGKPAVDETHQAIEPYCDLNRRAILKASN